MFEIILTIPEPMTSNPWLAIAAGVSAGTALFQGIKGARDARSQARQQQQQARQQRYHAISQAEDQIELTELYNENQEQAAAFRLSGAYAASGSYLEAATSARLAAETNAGNLLEEGRVTVGRMKRENYKEDSNIVARQAASGITIKRGSARIFRDDKIRTDTKDRAQTMEAYERQAQVVRQGGEVQVAELNTLAGAAIAEAQQTNVMAAGDATIRTATAKKGLESARRAPMGSFSSSSGSLFSGLASGLGGVANAGMMYFGATAK
jgi:hypothetical protein